MFNFIDNDSFGTNSKNEFFFLRLFLTHHTVKHNTIFRQLLAHLKVKIDTSKISLWYSIKSNVSPASCYLEELKLRLIGEHFRIVGVKS